MNLTQERTVQLALDSNAELIELKTDDVQGSWSD